MNFKLYFRLTQKQIRLMSSNKSKNHYDSLGIPSSSTQSEVKSAYYKLSMQYHPDRNQTVESSQKFRDITEAYEVLGNAKSRRLYDKGLSFRYTATTTDKFHKSRETRSKPPPPSGRTPIYDFDEWSKNHYGATFQRQMNFKKRQTMQKEMREEMLRNRKMETFFFILTGVVIICTFIFQDRTDYDHVEYSTFPSKPKPSSEI